ncbi:unnamed protein product [Brassica rapa]|uniref:N-acetyl-gamma-glutamyl-phosphate reductase dimerisation domain-containing protein n=2 Tax=Brassica TaxID=3705 RepID=A0A8D9MFE3_BRACM|nr:unnamed protein product [Brassica rapa]
MSFRVSANNIALKRIIRIGLLGASGYTGAEEEEFVKVVDEGVVPRTHNVRGSNYCFVNVFPDRIPRRAIIISVIDNLVKGASKDNSKHNVAV